MKIKKKTFKYFFIYPPLIMNFAPLIGVPQLIGILEKNGIDSKQFDLNSKFFTQEFKKSFFDKFENDYLYATSNCFISDFSNNFIETIHKNKYSIDLLAKNTDFYLNELNFSRYILTDKKLFYNPILSHYALAVQAGFVDLLLNFEKQLFDELLPKVNELYSSGFLNNFKIDTNLLLRYISSDANIFKDYAEKEVNIILKDSPDCIGITINLQSQFFVGLTIGYLIKKIKPEIHVNIGGSFFSTFYTKFDNLNELFGLFFDSITYGNGENTALALTKYIKKEITIDEVPNILHSKNSKINENSRDNGLKLSSFPYQSFNGYNSSEYLAPEFIVPIQASCGCYWGRCKFCISKRDRSYQCKSVEQLFSEIEYLSKKYSTEYFYFWDNSIHPLFLDRLATLILKKKLKIKYSIYARFENDFNEKLLKKIKKSGCIRINWGLDSASENMLQYIDKGINIDNVKRILKASHKVGITNLVSLIMGYPTETEKDINENLKFFKENHKYIDIIMISPLVLFLEGSFFHSQKEKLESKISVPCHKRIEYANKMQNIFAINSKFWQEIAVYNLLYVDKYSNLILRIISFLTNKTMNNKFLSKIFIEHARQIYKNHLNL